MFCMMKYIAKKKIIPFQDLSLSEHLHLILEIFTKLLHFNVTKEILNNFSYEGCRVGRINITEVIKPSSV